jgi:hypothetical protein
LNFLIRISDDNDLVNHTVGVWQQRNARRLSPEDAREVINNVVGFFTLLSEWEAAEQNRNGGEANE